MAKRKVWLGAGALCVLVALYVAYPYHTLHRIEDALESGDQTALEDLIDWPSLREGLKDDLNTLATRALAEQAAPSGDPQVALGMGIAAIFVPVLVQRTVDTYVTPAGIAALMRREPKAYEAASARTGASRCIAPTSPGPAAFASSSAIPTIRGRSLRSACSRSRA
jgi:hypothetical protein